MKIPVVLSAVQVHIDTEGLLSVELDGEPGVRLGLLLLSLALLVRLVSLRLGVGIPTLLDLGRRLLHELRPHTRHLVIGSIPQKLDLLQEGRHVRRIRNTRFQVRDKGAVRE